ncbi:hypothetical protein MPL3356_600013 [Mesorhizobium plurifarium]|uniref:Uncharacterized protein n=1 Tax=Mesorhizobium plurifarium TaxID=69974 RepID=A0A090G8I9_MESPL|nr:hypothetical protein MPL3356_600013 [Mesorhizobium plurifarium]
MTADAASDSTSAFRRWTMARALGEEKALVSALVGMYVQGVSAQGEGDHRGTVRSRLLGRDGECGNGAAG